MRPAVVRVGTAPFIFIAATVMSLTQATATTTITGASFSLICTSPEQLTACATSAKYAAQRCYEKECACSELDAFVGCYLEYCPGYGSADGNVVSGGVVNRFTCEETRTISRIASSRRAAASEAAESTGGLGGGITESRVTAAPTPASTGSSGSTSGGNSDQNSTTSTNDASKLLASAGVLFGSFIGVLALL
ncbi:hypothetical protein ACLOAV_005714 [Pseudogymnoascus australis]